MLALVLSQLEGIRAKFIGTNPKLEVVYSLGPEKYLPKKGFGRELDIKMVNSGNATALINSFKLDLNELQTEGHHYQSYVVSTSNYLIALSDGDSNRNYEINVSHALKPGDADRFVVFIAMSPRPEGFVRWYLTPVLVGNFPDQTGRPFTITMKAGAPEKAKEAYRIATTADLVSVDSPVLLQVRRKGSKIVEPVAIRGVTLGKYSHHEPTNQICEFLVKMIMLDPGSVRFEFLERQQKDGVAMADVFFGTLEEPVHYNTYLVSYGVGKFNNDANPKYLKEFKEAQESAMVQQLGVWSSEHKIDADDSAPTD
ncbi:hypothetical protein N9L06_00985 [Mariniblastus sp.]|nr:hypothetical protein [Mariniblastus sp.]